MEFNCRKEITPSKTAIMVMDVWDKVWCASLEKRMHSFIPAINNLLVKARGLGFKILHCPSDCDSFYYFSGDKRRLKAMEITKLRNLYHPLLRSPVPMPDYWYPPWGFTGGCECGPDLPCVRSGPQTRQHPGVDIMDDDLIIDGNNNVELFSICNYFGYNSLIYLGFASNMCLSWTRRCSIWFAMALGFDCVFVRDLTVGASGKGYNPDTRQIDPNFTPEKADEVIIKHLEKYFCPSITSHEFDRKSKRILEQTSM